MLADQSVDFNARYGERLDPDKPQGWDNPNRGKDRRLSRFFLTTILSNGSLRGAIHRSIIIEGAWFPEGMSLGETSLDGSLAILGSRFGADVDLRTTRIGGSLVMRQNAVQELLDLSFSYVGGSMLFEQNTFYGKFDLIGATIEKVFVVSNTKIIGDIRMGTLSVGSRIGIVNNTIFEGNVSINSVKVGGPLLMKDSRCSEPTRHNPGGQYVWGPRFNHQCRYR